MKPIKIIRAVTASQSIGFFRGLIPELQESGYEVVAVSSGGPEQKDVEKAGAKAITVNMERHISPIKDLRSLWQMIKVFRRERPDMVHSMTPKAGLICMLASKITGVPVRMHTFTGLVFPTSTGLKRRILMATDWLTCACATHIIPEGEGVKSDLLNNGITRKPIKVLGYGNCRGIDLERFNPGNEELRHKAAEIKEDGIFTFIFIGRLVRDKGINELVGAFKRLNSQYPATRLILVGPEEPELAPLLPETIAEIKSNGAINAVGEQSDVRPWLLASDALVFPSYREGFPNVVIEAGAMGLPSIVTDINGSREIIIEGENGIIIPSKDTEALYRGMKSFIENPEETAGMAANARALIASRFEQSYIRRCLKEYYKEILSNKK
ncbi:MAG: glycosyltransferase family 4 protein [Bacteroidales bacterium]|nr:glycosyltransferase family 4 protein [Bacteroidales bacterium]